MKDYSVNYIVCMFFGRRRSRKINNMVENDTFHLLKKHLKFLSQCDNEITEATIIVNGKFPDGLQQVVEECGPYKMHLTFIERDNKGFSYGAWNDALIYSLTNNKNWDYYFLLEDDYIPSKKDFYKPFVENCTDETPFICSQASYGDRNKRHAMISNGLIQGKACKEVYSKNNSVFLIYDTESFYGVAFQIQTDFYDLFTEIGYKFDDITNEYCFPFHDSVDDSIVYRGKENGEILLEPIS